jgi:hypothetical protein
MFKSLDESETLLHVYEGNLYWLFHVSSAIRENNLLRGYVNFFNSAKYTSISRNRLRLFFFKTLLNIAIKGVENRIVISADTEGMSKILATKTGQEFETYPIYSILNPGDFENLRREETLFLIRGENMMELLISYLIKMPAETLKKITVHGVPLKKQIDICESLGVKVSKKHLVGAEYSDFYKAFKSVVIFYDPKIFQNQSSGRLCDALVAGCHVVLIKNSALAESAASFGGYSEFELSGISEMLESLFTDSPLDFPRSKDHLPTSSRAVSKIIEKVLAQSRRINSKLNPLKFSAIFILSQVLMFALRLFYGANLRIRRALSRI